MTRSLGLGAHWAGGLALLAVSGLARAASDPPAAVQATDSTPSSAVTASPSPDASSASGTAPAAPSAPDAAVSAAAPNPGSATAAPATPSRRRKAQPPSAEDYGGPPLLLGDGKRKVKVGAYGGLGGAYTRFMGRDSGLVSIEGALLLDHRLSLGVAAYGFTRTPRGPAAADGTKQEFGAGYIGFAARYSVFGSLPVYPTFGLVLGAGAVNLHHDHGWDDESDWDDGFRHHDHDDDDEWERGLFDPFLFVQPELALNANATRWLRLGATVGYRFTSGVGRFGLDNSDLNGVVVGGNIQIGWF